MTQLDVRVHGGDTRCIVAPRGELDMSTVERLEDVLLPLVVDGTPAVVIVDLRAVTFMDSSGLRCLLTCRERLLRQRRRLAIVRGPEAVQRVFEITATEDLFETVDRPSQATGPVH
ncbi:MAG: STAS domain-containing protein [Thermoleophilaceae bacterium]